MTMKNKLLVLTMTLLWLAACTKEEDSALTQELFVATELQSYFDQFEEEGRLRGLDIDLVQAQVEGYIENITEHNIAGNCTYSTGNPHVVTIDRQFWGRSSPFQREYIVFHELGHCYLERDHLDESHPDGTCVSIMANGLGDCRANYFSTTREEYIDELFGF